MRSTLDIVIPVKFPSIHLYYLRKLLNELPRDIRVKYVLDCHSDVQINVDKMNFKAHEEVVSGKFGSPGLARNAGLDQGKSDYVIFWDVDDEPNLMQTINLLNYVDSNGGDVGIGNWVFRDSPDKLQGISPLSVGISPGIWRFLFRREFIKDIRFSNLKWGEDQLFILRVLAKNPKILTCKSAVYGYTKHVQGALTTETENVLDLIEVNTIGLNFLCAIKDGARVCAEVMHFRQILTVLKHRKVRAAWKLMFYSVINIRARQTGLLKIFLQWRRSTKW